MGSQTNRRNTSNYNRDLQNKMDKASNKSDVDFVYENKGTYGEWQSTCTTWNSLSSSYEDVISKPNECLWGSK